MKPLNQLPRLVISLVALLLFSGCEHDIAITSDVHENGSLDRTIVLHETDSATIDNNIFGIHERDGWDVVVEPSPEVSAEQGKNPEMNLTFSKHFASVDDANREMNAKTDTVFHISSTFKKRNRWFYTYIEYRDTYRALNLFNAVSKDLYFTREDFAFIERLPAEGRAISKADSLYLSRLNEKIFDFYGSRTIFEEFYQHVVSAMQTHDVPSRWQDSVARRKEQLYQRFVEVGNLDEGEFVTILSDLNIPLPEAARESIQGNTANIEKRLEFLSKAYSGKYVHVIRMPWDIVESNADTVVNNQLVWRPPVLKFLLTDFTMSATARKMNVWAVVASGIVVLLTVAMFLYRGKRSMNNVVRTLILGLLIFPSSCEKKKTEDALLSQFNRFDNYMRKETFQYDSMRWLLSQVNNSFANGDNKLLEFNNWKTSVTYKWNADSTLVLVVSNKDLTHGFRREVFLHSGDTIIFVHRFSTEPLGIGNTQDYSFLESIYYLEDVGTIKHLARISYREHLLADTLSFRRKPFADLTDNTSHYYSLEVQNSQNILRLN